MTTDELTQTARAMLAKCDGKSIQYRRKNSSDEWVTVARPTWDCVDYEYRIKPKPVSRDWRKPEDVPPVCWIKRGPHGWPCLVTEIRVDGIVIGSCHGLKIKWEDIYKDDRYSTDLREWLPCKVTEEAK